MLDSHLWCSDRQQLDRSSRSAGNLNDRAFHNLPPPPPHPSDLSEVRTEKPVEYRILLRGIHGPAERN